MISHPHAEAQVVDQRVRITQNSGATYTGQVTERSDSLLVIWEEISNQDVSISYADMRALSISEGMGSHARTGLLVGSAAGIGTSLLICAGQCNLRGTVILSVLGVASIGFGGARVGKLFEREDWTSIPIPGQTALRIEPLLDVSLAARPVFGVRLKL